MSAQGRLVHTVHCLPAEGCFEYLNSIQFHARCKNALGLQVADGDGRPNSEAAAGATLLFLSLQLEEKVVTAKDLQKRQCRESKESLLAALEQFRLANVLEEVERQVPGTTLTDAPPRGQKRRRGADPRAASSSSAPLLIMSSDMTEPCAFVKRSGQESFPSFRLKKTGDWPESTFLTSVKQEHARRDQRRQKGLRQQL